MSWRYYDAVFEADELDREQAISPWSGHRHFAYDLVRFLEPARVVELGTHIGGSFFSFCQAVKDAGLQTELWAVDTWQGDEHAGFYGEDVYGSVVKIVTERFSGQSIRLQRMLFDEAASKAEDNSIDLIHIDGLHTYEATRHDFETWVPKLRDQGIILFHDVGGQAREAGYGSTRAWEELKAQYPALTFEHSWGLGVLFPKGASRLSSIGNGDFDAARRLYEYRAARDLGRERSSRDLAWEQNRANKEWERAEKLNVDLNWQKGVTTEHWRRAEELAKKVEALTTELLSVRNELASIQDELRARRRLFDLVPGRVWTALERLKTLL